MSENGRFLITGLPRSRTAWWSVVSGALHEPIAHEGYSAFACTWAAKPDLGVSDAMASLYLPQIVQEFEPRILIVERPLSEVIVSARRFLGDEFERFSVACTVTRMKMALDDFGKHSLVARVNFHDLTRIEIVEVCLNWLRVPEPLNLEQLLHMNIQTDLGFNMRLLAEKTGRVA